MTYCSTCGYPAPCGRCEDSDNPSARIRGYDVRIDVYHPLVASDHDPSCAALCTNWNSYRQDDSGCDLGPHHCWCPDGGLSYVEFQAKHPDVCVAEAD